MPDLQAPGHYSRSNRVMPDHMDWFFKWIPHDHYIEITGQVDCPIGWVGLVKVDDDMINLCYRELGMWDSRVPTSGWYNIRFDEAGFVWAMWYGFDATLPEESARADFAEAVAAYSEWDDLNDPYRHFDDPL